MYHFLPMHHLEWHFLAGSKVENITLLAWWNINQQRMGLDSCLIPYFPDPHFKKIPCVKSYLVRDTYKCLTPPGSPWAVWRFPQWGVKIIPRFTGDRHPSNNCLASLSLAPSAIQKMKCQKRQAFLCDRYAWLVGRLGFMACQPL